MAICRHCKTYVEPNPMPDDNFAYRHWRETTGSDAPEQIWYTPDADSDTLPYYEEWVRGRLWCKNTRLQPVPWHDGWNPLEELMKDG